MINLTYYPVTINSGIVNNIFAGYEDVFVSFERKDLDVFNVEQGTDNKIAIILNGDYSSILNVGEWIYLYAIGSSYTYNGSYQIIDIDYNDPNTSILVDGDFIEIASTGYVNYKQNWFIECKLVDVINPLSKVYSDLLTNCGTPSGVVKLYLNTVMDYLNTEILDKSAELKNSRVRFNVKWREVWRENLTNEFQLIDDTPIIIYKAGVTSVSESFLTDFAEPKMWEGYPFFINSLHSKENTNERLKVTFDELDINKDAITTDNKLNSFDFFSYGILQTNFTKSNTTNIDSNTRYLQFNLTTTNSADFSSEFESGDFLTE